MHSKNEMVYLAAVALSAVLSAPVFADPPAWAGGGKSDKHESKSDKRSSKEHKQGKRFENETHEKESNSKLRKDDNRTYRDEHGKRIAPNDYFRDSHRSAVHDYYTREFRAGNCPPGLAKKNNGCFPPGQAKKWHVGRTLPQNIQYYPLPPEVVSYLGPAPVGYQYVRVDNDILLLAAGTRLVIDAIRNLGF